MTDRCDPSINGHIWIGASIRCACGQQPRPTAMCCIHCEIETMIVCEACKQPTCWDHQHNYGTHNEPLYTIGQEVEFGGHRFRIMAMTATRRRWIYDGRFLAPDGTEKFAAALGVWESDLQKQPLG